MGKISARATLASIESTDVIGGFRPGAPSTDYQIPISVLLAGLLQPVTDPFAVNGVDQTTTAVLNYGINVVRAASNVSFAAIMPAPKKGKQVTVVNAGTAPIQVFPAVGGSINGVLNGSATIPNNSKAVVFYCFENPVPGDWTTPSPLSTIFSTPELSINHTNGVADNQSGLISLSAAAPGAAVDGSGNLILTPTSPNWKSYPYLATAIRMNVYTNIVAGNAVAGSDIVVSRVSAYKTASNAATSGQRETAFFANDAPRTGSIYAATGGAVANGTVNTPAEIGDTGTFYIHADAPMNIGNQLGTGGAFSSYYFTFKVNIPANAATKLYKFRIELEYI